MYIHTVNIGSTLALDLNKFQMKGKSSIIYRLLVLASVCMGMFAAASCVQMEIEEYPEIGEGISDVRFDVEFRPLDSVDPATRTAGDAVRHISSVHVVVYKTDGTLFSNHSFADVNTSEQNTSGVTLTPPGGSSGFAEATYCRASFDLQLPLGEYRIYAIANYTPTDAQMASEEALKAISFTWNTNVAKNNAMFGYFTNGDQSVPSYDSSKPAGNRFAAPTIRIDRSNLTLHAWVRRIVSKVTVGFDGTNLNENVYIYIHSVQIKDIPSSVSLGVDNKPSSGMIANGEKVLYRPSSSAVNTAGLRVTKGVPTGISMGGTLAEGTILDNSSNSGGVHHEASSNSLFLFENLQGNTATLKGKWQDSGDSFDSDGNITGSQDGAIDHPDGGTSGTIDFKDGVANGSYIEVKAYYVNKTSTNASQGEIVYRFMLGKDVDRNCDVERSNHYKVTLRFIKDANNVDWHISYTPENPEISVPTPLYISYGYNEVLNIPVIVRGASASANTTIRAEIIENPWGYPDHKYYKNSNHDDLNDGFLSFENMKGTVSISETQRNAWNKAGSQYLSAVRPTKTDVDAVYYSVPVYTRPLILSNSLTGHNPYVSQQRKATVRFTVSLDGRTYKQDIEVIQVKRLVNPAGVWRSDTNTSPFNIRLMELNEPDSGEKGMTDVDFYAPLSDGPWTAHIEDGVDWVQIAPTGSGAWGTEDIKGGTGSEIRFDYRPKNQNTTGAVRCGVIKITYHNNNCVHYVFVSQGLGTVNLAGTKWQNRNVLRKNELVQNPLMEGSMFKFGNPSDAILVDNNYRSGYGFDISCWGKKFYINTKEGTQKTFESLGNDLSGFTDTRKIFTTNTNVKPGTYAQWKALETLHRRYGVMYGDECTETMTNTIDAYSYWQVGQNRGMQGMFVWDESRGGNHIFFPIGSTGNGHRKVNDNAYISTYGTIDKYSHLKYAQRPYEMPVETAKAVPMYYDIWLRKGGVYWYDTKVDNALEFGATKEGEGYAHDINYHSMLFQTYGKNPIGQSDKNGNKSTDACYIRCVEP